MSFWWLSPGREQAGGSVDARVSASWPTLGDTLDSDSDVIHVLPTTGEVSC